MNNNFDWVDEVLIPSLHDGNIANAFAEYGINFVRWGRKWTAKNYLDGKPHGHRKDKIWTSSTWPHLVSEQGGATISLIRLYQNLSGLDYHGAVAALASKCGLSVPERMESEEIKRWREMREDALDLLNRMKAELYQSQGAATLAYLKDVRGYDDGFLDYAQFGYCSPASVEALRSIAGRYGLKCNISGYIGKDNVLAIPYFASGKLLGFNFRRIDNSQAGPKYCNVFFTASASKSHSLFGLSGLKLTGNRERDTDIVVVEGELDALRASYVGIENVVAMGGYGLSDDALQEAKRKGVKRVCVLFDTDIDKEGGWKDISPTVASTIDRIWKHGLDALVAYYPRIKDKHGQPIKMDADKYLSLYSVEGLKDIIYNARAGESWLYDKMLDKYSDKQGDNDALADRDFSDLTDEVIKLIARIPSKVQQERIARSYSELTGGDISLQTLLHEGEQKAKEQSKNRVAEEVEAIANKILALTKEGDLAGAIEQGKRLSALTASAKEEEYAKAAISITLSDVRQRYLNKPDGIHTGYLFGLATNEERDELILHPAALTFIAAPTSHGKTTFLQNLALGTALSEGNGQTVFITFEESEEDIATEFEVMYFGESLSAKSLRSLRSYYSGKRGLGEDGTYFEAGKLARLQEMEPHFDNLLKTKLRIYQRPNQIDDLSGFIDYLHRTYPIKAVFVDYVQRIKANNIRGTRKDVLEAVCDELMRLSLSTGLPIVLGAQLNRQALSPLEMENQNIADASDIEHCANTIVLLWNSNTPQLASSNWGGNEEMKKRVALLEYHGFNIGNGGKMYALLSKNRSGNRNKAAILTFDGNTRRITQHYPDTLDVDTQPQPVQAEATATGRMNFLNAKNK